LLGFGKVSVAQKCEAFQVNYFTTLPHISIRALHVVSDSQAWFAANHGVWGYTEDSGLTWHIDSIKAGVLYPEFRSIEVLDDSTVLLMSISSPAYIFKTINKGKTWKQVYTNKHEGIFFDSMQFCDKKNGIAIGDPIEGCFQVLPTSDGGETWQQTDCIAIPEALDGEACFAASNTNVEIRGGKSWFVTGGKHARIFYSPDSGSRFFAYDTPMVQGEKMTGIFSFDFLNDRIGIIAGGNYEKTDSSVVNLAITENGGKTWKKIKSKKPFFGSCVQFKSANTFFVTGHDGTCMYSRKKNLEVKDKQGGSLKYNTLRFSPSGKTLWLAGDKGGIAFITFAL
jgi:photosystem II stability/assembly factor-like uncharacterized protein